MPVTNYFIVGNFTVPSSWIALMIAWIISYFVLRLFFHKKSAELLSDAAFYMILIWKLSVVLTDFQSIKRTPLAIVYFDGGFTGFLLGLFFVLMKLFWMLRQEMIHYADFQRLLIGVMLTQSIYQMMMSLFNDGDFFVRIVTFVLFFVFAVMMSWMMKTQRLEVVYLPLLMSAFHLFVASFQPDGLMSRALWTTWLVSAGWSGLNFWHHRTIKRRRKEHE